MGGSDDEGEGEGDAQPPDATGRPCSPREWRRVRKVRVWSGVCRARVRAGGRGGVLGGGGGKAAVRVWGCRR